MFGSAILDTTIGLVFVYLILSLICSALQEIWAGIRNLRSDNLDEGIRNLLQDPNIRDLSQKVYAHPLVKKLAREGKKPSYIPARNFATALFDTLKDPNDAGSAFQQAAASVAKLPAGDIKVALTALIEDAQGDVEKARKNVEVWFDDAMDRVSGWYKRYTQIIMLVIALILTVALNVDSIEVAKKLWQEPALREMVVNNAEKIVAEGGGKLTFSELQKKLNEQTLPIGWPQLIDRYDPDKIWDGRWIVLQTLLGWLLTAVAVSLGAPFWFDTLQRFLSIRAAGKKPEKSSPT